MKSNSALFRVLRAVCSAAAMSALLFQSSHAAETVSPLTLFYTNAAANWTEALAVGNGRLGAMVEGQGL